MKAPFRLGQDIQEHINSIQWIGFDTETCLITEGRLAPRDVCHTFYDGTQGKILKPKEGAEHLLQILQSGDGIVCHNTSFDMGVVCQNHPHMLPHVWMAYDEGRILDTMIIEQLYYIGRGWFKTCPRTNKKPRFSLAVCVENRLGETVEGKDEDAWRYKYNQLIDLEIKDWPKEAVSYAVKDAEYVWRLFKKQIHPDTKDISNNISPDAVRQCQADWSLHLVSSWGLRTETEAVEKLGNELHHVVETTERELLEKGLYKEDKKGVLSKNLASVRALVEEAYDGNPPTTATGAISTAVAVLKDSGNASLQKLASISNDQKLLNTYLPVLKSATKKPLNPRYYLVESGRTSARSPNIQNMPRKGGVRECFIPRDGFAYVACDYHIAELCSLAQVLLHKFGSSKMADALNSGKDLHLETAAGILGTTYDEAMELYKSGNEEAKEARQLAKALNFGLPAGLGSQSFSSFAKTIYGVDVTPERSQQLKEKWLASYPEMQKYYAHIGNALSFRDSFTAKHIFSNRLRGGVGYCDGCNTYFQGLAADGAKRALYNVVKATHIKSDVLFGCHVVAFVHDEILLESPIDRVHDVGLRLSELMVSGMKEFLPDIAVRATPHAMDRWYKDAEPVYENGKLVRYIEEAKV